MADRLKSESLLFPKVLWATSKDKVPIFRGLWVSGSLFINDRLTTRKQKQKVSKVYNHQLTSLVPCLAADCRISPELPDVFAPESFGKHKTFECHWDLCIIVLHAHRWKALQRWYRHCTEIHHDFFVPRTSRANRFCSLEKSEACAVCWLCFVVVCLKWCWNGAGVLQDNARPGILQRRLTDVHGLSQLSPKRHFRSLKDLRHRDLKKTFYSYHQISYFADCQLRKNPKNLREMFIARIQDTS